jgi:hypothetical protein
MKTFVVKLSEFLRLLIFFNRESIDFNYRLGSKNRVMITMTHVNAKLLGF